MDFTLLVRQGKHNKILTSWCSEQLPVAQATLCEQEATIWDMLHFLKILFWFYSRQNDIAYSIWELGTSTEVCQKRMQSFSN